MRSRQLGEPLDNPPLAIIGLRVGVQRRSIAAIQLLVRAGDEADRRIVFARQQIDAHPALPVVFRIPGSHRHDARVAAAALRQPAAGLQADMPSRSANTHTSDGCGHTRTASIAAATFGAAITSSHVPIARPPSACSPIHATDKILARPFGLVRRAAQHALLVFVHVENDRLAAFAANHFLPVLKIEPAGRRGDIASRSTPPAGNPR